jgi:holin-like protein
MQVLTGFTALLVAQAGGELLGRLMQSSLQWSLPGPVLGMLIILLALALPSGRFIAEPVSQAAEPLMTHLSLLFIPVGVGVIVHLSLIAAHGWRLAVVLIVSTMIGLLTTAWVLHKLWPQQPTPPVPPSSPSNSAATGDAA